MTFDGADVDRRPCTPSRRESKPVAILREGASDLRLGSPDAAIAWGGLPAGSRRTWVWPGAFVRCRGSWPGDGVARDPSSRAASGVPLAVSAWRRDPSRVPLRTPRRCRVARRSASCGSSGCGASWHDDTPLRDGPIQARRRLDVPRIGASAGGEVGCRFAGWRRYASVGPMTGVSHAGRCGLRIAATLAMPREGWSSRGRWTRFGPRS